MSVTVCLIVKNEAKHLSECLLSAQQIADVLMVMDTGSTDDTVALAKAAGTIVYQMGWKSDFSLARNLLLEHVSTEWVFMMDADDRIPDSSAHRITSFLKSDQSKSVDVLLMPYMYNTSDGRSAHSAYTVRAWKRSLNLEYKYPVHEVLQVTSDLERYYLDAPIIHQKQQSLVTSSLFRNLNIEEAYLMDSPDDLRMLYYACHDSFFVGHFEQAIQYGERFVYQSHRDAEQAGRIFYYMAESARTLGMAEQMLDFLHQAILVFPNHPEPYLMLGAHESSQGQYKLACEWYKRASQCRHTREHTMFYNEAVYTYVPEQRLAHCYYLLGDYQAAKVHAQRAIQMNPTLLDNLKHIYVGTV